MDPARELAQVPERDRQLFGRVLEQLLRGRRRVLRPLARQPQRERERDEPLLGTVVQVPLESTALGVLRLDEPVPGGAELVLGPLAVGDVAEEASEDRQAWQPNPGDCELDRELGA